MDKETGAERTTSLSEDFDRLLTASRLPVRSSASLVPGERRNVAVLFLDVAGYTGFTEGRDPEEVRLILGRTFELFSSEIERHGGAVEKFIGDAICGTFGAKVAHEDDALRAVHAALSILDRLQDVNVILRPHGIELSVRIGVNTGPVATGKIAEFDTVVGDAVNVASRLQSSAQVNTVLVARDVVYAAGADFNFEPRGVIDVRGRSEPVETFTLLGPSRRHRERWERSPLLSSAPFVGRAGELERVVGAIRRSATERRFAAIAVFGSAGIGKSRLVDEAARSLGAKTVKGRTFSFASRPLALAASVLLDALRGIAPTPDDGFALLRAAVDESALAGWDAAVSITLAALGLSDPAALSGVGREQLSTAVSRVLSAAVSHVAAGSSAPLVVVVEDLHWADEISLEILHRSFVEQESLPVCAVFVSRDRDSLGPCVALRPLEVELAPLGDRAVREMVGGILGGVPPSDPVDHAIHTAQGLPYYVEEFLLALVDAGFLSRGPDGAFIAAEQADVPVPMSLSSLVLSRVDALPRGLRQALQRASVLGSRFREFVFLDLSDRLGVDRATARDELASLVSSDFLVPQDLMLAFRHEITREAVYSTVLRANKRLLHTTAARVLQDAYAGTEDQVAGLIAHHYVEADEVEPAARWCLRAAEVAQRATDGASAIEWAERGAELALRLTSPEGERMAVKMLLIQAQVVGQSGRLEEQRRLIVRAKTLAVNAGVPELEADAILGEAYLDLHTARSQEGLTLAQDVLDRLADRSSPTVRISAHSNLSALLFAMSRFEEAERHGQEAVRLAREHDEREMEARALIFLGMVYMRQGRFADAEKTLLRSAELYLQIGWIVDRMAALVNLGFVLSSLERPIEAVAVLREAYGVLDGLGVVRNSAACLGSLSFLTMERGKMLEAERLALDALRRFGKIGDLRGVTISVFCFGQIAYLSGERESARTCLHTVLPMCERSGLFHLTGHSRSLLAELEIDEGRLDDAELLLRAVAEVESRGALDAGGRIRRAAAAAYLSAARGESGAAARLAEVAATIIAEKAAPFTKAESMVTVLKGYEVLRDDDGLRMARGQVVALLERQAQSLCDVEALERLTSIRRFARVLSPAGGGARGDVR